MSSRKERGPDFRRVCHPNTPATAQGRPDLELEVRVIAAHGVLLFLALIHTLVLVLDLGVLIPEHGPEIGDLGLEQVDLVVGLVVLLERLVLLGVAARVGSVVPGDVEWAASAFAIPSLGRYGVLDLGRGAVAVDYGAVAVVRVVLGIGVVTAVVGKLVHRVPEVGELPLAEAVLGVLAPQFFGCVLREFAILYAPG